MGDVDALPTDWRKQCDPADRRLTARVVGDYIAGMTDRYAIDEHARLFGPRARS
jgi:dGTPase